MPERRLDVAIVGAGIAGVIHLHFARRAGLDALAFDKQPGVGGLWRQLPAWQDIQIRLVDWTLGDIPLTGPTQPHIQANIEAWVESLGLADGIRLNTPVKLAREDEAGWALPTPQGVVHARHLVAATGARLSAGMAALGLACRVPEAARSPTLLTFTAPAHPAQAPQPVPFHRSGPTGLRVARRCVRLIG